MKNKKLVFVILSVIAIVIPFCIINEIVAIRNEKDSQNRIFKEMQKESKEVIRGIVGIIPETKKDDNISHNGIGSGVIFDKKDNTYYIVTAKHVIENKDSKFKIFT